MKIGSIYIFILFLLLTPNNECFSQIISDNSKALIFLEKAEKARVNLDQENTLKYRKKALEIYRSAKDVENIFYVKNQVISDLFLMVFYGKNKYKEELLTNYESLLSESEKVYGKKNIYEAHAYLTLSNYYSQVLNKHKIALELLNKAIEIVKKKGQYPQKNKGYFESRCYNTKILILHKKQEFKKAKQFGEKAFALLQSKYGKNHETVNSLYLNLALVNHQLQNYEDALSFYNNYINFRKNNNLEYAETGLFENLGNLYLDIGNYNKAIEYYEKALLIKKKIKSKDIKLLKSYNRIGGVYQELGKYREAIEYYKKALDGIIVLRGENNAGSASFYNNIGECLYLQGKYNEALLKHKTALTIRLKTIGSNAPYTTNSYHNIGKAYLGMHQFDSAEFYIKKGLNLRILLDKSRTDMKKYVADSYNNMGLVNIKLNNYDQALGFFYKALNEFINLYGNQHPDIAATYNHIGDVNSLQNKIDLSLLNYHNAIIANTTNFNNLSLDALPKANDYVKPYILLTSLNAKALILERNYLKKNNNDVNYLIQAYNTYKLCVDFLSLSRKTQYYNKDKLNLMKKSRGIYEGGIRVCYDLYKITNELKYLKEAFFFSEKSKATILSDKTIEENAKLFSDIPDSLIIKEEEINESIASYEVRLQREKLNKKVNKQRVKVFKDSLFELKRKEEKLIDYFELNYPKYHELKYNKPIATLEKVQASLKNKSTLIEYFIARGSTYVFLIEKDKFLIKEIKNTNQTASIIKLLSESVKSHNFENYTKYSYDIYSKIFKPLKNDITGKKLIIIPDGSLWYLNFDILLTQKENYQKYSNLPYLIKDYIISYAYTADLLYQDKAFNSNIAINECLAFSYSNNGAELNNTKTSEREEIISMNILRNSSLDDLPGTRKEIADISNLMEGKYYYGYSANEKNFKEVAKNYAVLHLALHGEVNDKDPLQSKLFFTKNKKDSIEDDFLYAYELYNMELNADLAVLSACNTGVGELEGSEGVMSLGRAFIYAGCKSLLMSQWEISDWSTSGIMKSFYTYLSDGKPKDEALYYAKLDYLENSDNISADPAYWAPLVFLGDNSPQIKPEINYFFIAFILLALSSILIFIKIKKM